MVEDTQQVASTPAGKLPTHVDAGSHEPVETLSEEARAALAAARNASWAEPETGSVRRRMGRANWVVAVLGLALVFALPVLVLDQLK